MTQPADDSRSPQPNGASGEGTQQPNGTEPDSVHHRNEDGTTDWKKTARAWEEQAKKWKREVAEAQPIVSQWRQLEEASKSELERANEQMTRWQQEAEQWRKHAVGSRVEALAAADFADPSDAVSSVDPSKYLDAGGKIDEQAIRNDLADLLTRKPHWRKPDGAAPTPRPPAPNPAQGAGGGASGGDPAQQLAAIIQAQLKG